MARAQAQGPDPYAFTPDRLDDAIACYRTHGFAIVRGMARPDVVADLRGAVEDVLGDPTSLAHGDNRTTPELVEHSPRALRLLDVEPYLELNRRLLGCRELTIHRSFAVLKNAGAGPVAWHRDYHHLEGDVPTEPDQFLDPGDHGARLLWYLDGSYPDEGGLWVVPGSHRADWPGLPGFAFTPGRKSFHRVGEPVAHYERFDAEEMLPLHVDPGDLLAYSLSLYHGASPQPRGVRRACAVILRAAWPALHVPWVQTEATRRFLEDLPVRYRPFVRNYVGIDYRWRA
jgi:ectoine hydroxylase-related dioxygenase (phytanoyl-CoA dioxygenase family)